MAVIPKYSESLSLSLDLSSSFPSLLLRFLSSPQELWTQSPRSSQSVSSQLASQKKRIVVVFNDCPSFCLPICTLPVPTPSRLTCRFFQVADERGDRPFHQHLPTLRLFTSPARIPLAQPSLPSNAVLMKKKKISDSWTEKVTAWGFRNTCGRRRKNSLPCVPRMTFKNAITLNGSAQIRVIEPVRELHVRVLLKIERQRRRRRYWRIGVQVLHYSKKVSQNLVDLAKKTYLDAFI